MSTSVIDNKGQGTLFRSKLLERLSRTNPFVIYSIYVPVIVCMLYYAANYKVLPPGRITLLFMGGILCWSLFEYIVHRFLFHMNTTGPRGERFVYIMHGIHHQYPRDKSRLFMPVIPSITLATVIFLLMRLLLGWNCFAFFPGFLLGYLLYGSMHYAMHAFPPPRFLKALWRNHSLHHYQSPNKGLGVSSVLWDVIFGTVPQKQEKTNDHTVTGDTSSSQKAR